ncbi:MAG TPA: hypothetical protein VL053_15170 [Arachidicoccus sp.]|nr:hypothetical protein [Arachidicoccus sp.]
MQVFSKIRADLKSFGERISISFPYLYASIILAAWSGHDCPANAFLRAEEFKDIGRYHTAAKKVDGVIETG